MGRRARSRRQFDRYWDGKGKWGITRQIYSYIDRKALEEVRPESRVLIKNGGKP